MIKVNVLKENDLVKEVIIKGHANYEEFGKDIVCASVSTMTQTTINDILTLDKEAITYETKDGELRISVKKNNKVAIALLETMLTMLKELENTYPKNIKIGG